MTAKKSIPMSTGVAGIRGAKEDEKAKLYWKGKKGGEGVTEEELTEFKSAVDLAAAGQKDAAVKELEEFIAQFPDSPLVSDAKKTLEMVKAEGKQQ
jgi:TolA-binding protein